MSSLMEYKGYRAKIGYDEDDGIFVGEVIGIADSLNFHGTAVDELKTAFHQSIDNYLAICKAVGKQPEKEYSGSFNIRTSPELHKKMCIAAANEGISLNQFVNNALEKSLNKRPAQKRGTSGGVRASV